MAEPLLELDGVSVSLGGTLAVNQVDLSVASGERLALLGPSGAGKSTLLRAIAGLEPLAAGSIWLRGRDLAGVPVHRRGIGLLFQDYMLFPQLDVVGNVEFGLRMRGDPLARRRARVAEVLDLVGLVGLDERRITELSGGEQQRVALARALAPAPELLMLDEPLGALDRALRERLLNDLAELFARLALTIIYVTHDQSEALALADRVALMHDGRLEAVMPPEQLWASPPSAWAARFLGFANVFEAEVSADGSAQTPWGRMHLADPPAPGRYTLLVRPTGVRLTDAGPLVAKVDRRTFRGDVVVLGLAVEGAVAGAPLLVGHVAPPGPVLGESVHLTLAPAAVVTLAE